MIFVHHLNNSRSQRILWLLEELGLDYEVVKHTRNPGTNLAPPEIVNIHPLGKLPIIRDADLTLAESGAIIEYILDTYGQGRLAPAHGTPERTRYTYWMHYAEGSAMPVMLLWVVFGQIETARTPFFIRPITRALSAQIKRSFVAPQLDRHLDFLEAELGDHTWFAGDTFSAADIQMSFPIEAAAARAGLNQSRPRLMAYLDRIHARPAFQRAVDRGGPYQL